MTDIQIVTKLQRATSIEKMQEVSISIDNIRNTLKFMARWKVHTYRWKNMTKVYDTDHAV